MIDVLCQTVIQAATVLAVPAILVGAGIAWLERHG